jgi:GTP-binding protein EngB required for normal cell division
MDERLRDTASNGGESSTLATLAKTLDYAVRALQASVGQDSGLVRRLGSLKERLQDSRLQLAVLGQFKRGKSTLINALLGAPLLPVAVVPLTAVPVFISWRQSSCVRIQFKDGRPPEELSAHEPGAIRDFLFRVVAEEANPQNGLGVSRVDLFYPAPLLSGGTVLIDTPGVGSTFRHNTEAALGVLPECDAALFVISTDPPITEAELDFLRQITAKAARIFYILNKIDYLGADERESVANFLREVLEQNGLWTPDSKILSVSARDGLQAKQRSDRRALESSGMADVEALLIRQLATEKTNLLEVAMASKIADGLSHGISEVSLRIQALKLPVDELASKAKLFGASLHAIEDRQRIMRDVLAGEQRNLRQEIEQGIASLRNEASSELARLLTQTRAGEGKREALSTAIERTFDAARVKMVQEFSRRMDVVLADYQKRIDADVGAIRRTVAEIFQTPFSEFTDTAVFSLSHEPYWVTQETSASLLPDPGLWLENLLPEKLRARQTRSRILRQVNELVIRNAENLRWALLRGTDDAFRAATASFQTRLDEAVRATRSVIDECLTRRRDASHAIEVDLDRLNRARDLLSVLRQKITVRRLDLFASPNNISLS